MANPTNINLVDMGLGLELERICVELNQSENLVHQQQPERICVELDQSENLVRQHQHQPESLLNTEQVQQFNVQAQVNRTQSEDKNAQSFSKNVPVPQGFPMPPVPHTMTEAEIMQASKLELQLYASYASRKIIEQHQITQQLLQQRENYFKQQMQQQPQNNVKQRTQQHQDEDVEQRIQDQQDDFEQRIQDLKDDFEQRIEDHRDDFEQRIQDNQDDFEQRIQDNQDDFEQRIQQQQDDLEQQNQQQLNDFQQQIQQMQQEVARLHSAYNISSPN